MAEEQNNPENTPTQPAAAAEGNNEQPAGPQFAVQRIYLKDASFESPKSPDMFQANWSPKIKFNISSKNVQLQTGVFDVVLIVTIEARKDDEVAFLVEVHQSGIFTCVGFNAEELDRVLSTVCPNILFPYARETVDSLVVKGSFPPIQLAPVNFDALYLQRKEQEAKGDAGTDIKKALEGSAKATSEANSASD